MEPDLERLGMVVRARREALRLTQRDASLAADVSDTTWFSVEQGKKVSNRTLARVERAMQWAPGTIDAYLAGEEPVLPQLAPGVNAVVVEDRTTEERLVIVESELAELKAVVAKLKAFVYRTEPDPLSHIEGRRDVAASKSQRAG